MKRIPVDHRVDHDYVPEAPLTSPSATGGLLGVFRHRYVLRLLVRKEIQARYSGSFLGLFWSYVKPAIQFTMYYLVIGEIIGLHKSVPVFGVHMFAGLVFVHYFTETFNAGTRSIMRNKQILQKMAMPKELFPVASMLVSAFHVIPGVIILTLGCLALGWTPDPVGMGAFVLGFAIIACWGTAFALLFSAANVFFRDFGNLVQTLVVFATFSAPMIYPYTYVEDRFGAAAPFYLANPLAEAVLLNQRAFWIGTTDDPAGVAAKHLPDNLWELGFIHLGAAIVALALAQLVFSRLEGKFVERL